MGMTVSCCTYIGFPGRWRSSQICERDCNIMSMTCCNRRRNNKCPRCRCCSRCKSWCGSVCRAGVFVGVGVFVGPVVPVAVGVYVAVGTIITVLSSPHPINDRITERMRKIEMNNTFEFNIKSPFLLKIHREVLWKFLKSSVFYIKKAFFISWAVFFQHRTS